LNRAKHLLLSVVKGLRKNQKGFSTLEIFVAVVVMTIMTMAVAPNYTHFQKNAQTDLHVVNSMTFMNAVQSGLLEGWVSKPAIGEGVEVPLSTILSQGYINTVTDPSSESKAQYSVSASKVQVYNNGGVLEYYIKLTNYAESFTYISTVGLDANVRGSKQITQIDHNDVSLPF